MTIETDIANLKARKLAVEKNRMKLEIQHAEAERNFQQAQKHLEDEFGVSSVEQAKALLQQMEKNLNEKISAIQESLVQVEGR